MSFEIIELDSDDFLIDIRLRPDGIISYGLRLDPFRMVSVTAAGRFRIVFASGDYGPWLSLSSKPDLRQIRSWDEWLVEGHIWLRVPDGKSLDSKSSSLPRGIVRELFDGLPGVEFHAQQSQIGVDGPAGPGDTWPVMGNVLVAAFGAGGAGSVLAAALMKFFSRHRGKKVVFGVNGKVRSIQGYSAAEVERVIKATQLAMEQPFNQELDHVKEQLEQLLPDTSYMTLREEEDPGDSSPEWSSCAPSD